MRTDPLLVSVRSGPRVSMPGMMDTGAEPLASTDDTVQALPPRPRCAFFVGQLSPLHPDVFRRGAGLNHHLFEDALEIIKEDNGFYADVEMGAGALQVLVKQYEDIVADQLGRPFPQDVHEQLWGAIRARVRQLGFRPRQWSIAAE